LITSAPYTSNGYGPNCVAKNSSISDVRLKSTVASSANGDANALRIVIPFGPGVVVSW
jgi:hypothetical protein